MMGVIYFTHTLKNALLLKRLPSRQHSSSTIWGPSSQPMQMHISRAPRGIRIPSATQSKKSSQQSLQPLASMFSRVAGAMPFSPRPSRHTSTHRTPAAMAARME